MHTQQFNTQWPTVLNEMHEYVALTNLSLGNGRSGQVKVRLSRQLVAADKLKPHIVQFRSEFAVQFPRLSVEICAEDRPAHQVSIRYGE